MSIESAINEYKKSPTDKNFTKIYDASMYIFNPWCKKMEKITKTDRMHLLSEFGFMLFKAVKKYDGVRAEKWNGFERYFRSSLRKLSMTIQQRHKKMTQIPEDFDIPDPCSSTYFNKIDILECVKKHLTPTEGRILLFRAMGYNSEEIQKKMKISDYCFRNSISSIKQNRSLYNGLLSV